MLKEFNAYAQWTNVPHSKKEKPSGKSKTSLAGYLPADAMIKSMMDAGQRLYDSRSAVYDIPPGQKFDPDDVNVDPTRSKAFGLEDASVLARKVSNELQEQKKAAVKAAKEAEKVKKDAEEAAKAIQKTLDVSMAK